jgi:NDP-sugar pyrophosphorylase family protein
LRAIILSGGQGLRLRPLTDDRPKCLIEVKGRPICEYQMEWLKQEIDIQHIIFACGYRWEKLKEYFGDSYNGIKISYSVEEEMLGTGGAIKKAIAEFAEGEETIIAMNGDIITDLELSRMIKAHNSSPDITATMLVVPYRSSFGVVYIDKLKTVRKFEEKPEFPDVWINGGVYILNTRKILKRLPDKGDIERETFPRLVPHGELMAYPYYGSWWYIDTMKDLRDVELSLSPKTS